MILFLVAYILWFPLTILNYFFVKKKGYFRNTAVNIDVFANKEFRTLFNKTLITNQGYKFGQDNETISSVLGKNYLTNTLSTTGKILVKILTKDHVINAISIEL